MQMSQTEALSFIGSLLMRMMGVLLVVADSVVVGEKQRAYIMKQREWYEQQQDTMSIAEQVDELIGESMNDLQAKSTNTLALCPFCGGEAELLGERVFYVWCDKCETRGDYYNTEAEAIAAWNRRAKPPCGGGYCPLCGAVVDGIENWNSRAERTCQNVDDHKTVWFICSVCGYQQKLSHTRSYCPNCGCKVVGE